MNPTLTPEKLNKFEKFTLAKLKLKAQKHFNEFIRERDKGKPCISCGGYRTLQAGHFYSAGHYPALRFNEDNTHGQCSECNFFKSGNLAEYKKHLINKIGLERVQKLDLIAAQSKKQFIKESRFYFIEKILQYK